MGTSSYWSQGFQHDRGAGAVPSGLDVGAQVHAALRELHERDRAVTSGSASGFCQQGRAATLSSAPDVCPQGRAATLGSAPDVCPPGRAATLGSASDGCYRDGMASFGMGGVARGGLCGGDRARVGPGGEFLGGSNGPLLPDVGV